MKALIDKMVDRFLGWKLPKDFSPDAGISFKPTKPYEGDELGNSWWPIGTNLLTAEQTRAMIEYMLTDAVLIPCEEVSQVTTVGNVIAERNDYKARALSYEAANVEQGKLLNEVIAERDELLKDAERLNYLIAEECQVWEVNGRYSVCDVTERTAADKEYPSAREAIDAAIAKSKT